VEHLADDSQRPAEAANRADAEQRAAHVLADLRSDPHHRAMDQLSVVAPAGGYAKPEGSS